MFRNLQKTTAVFILAQLSAYAICTGQAGYADTSYYQGMGIDYKCTGGLVLPDSSVLAIGRFAYVNQRLINGIVQLKKDGRIDDSFDPGTGADEHVNQVVRQPDGKLILGGDFKTFNGDSVFHIVRLNANGSRDYTFLSGSGFTAAGTIYSLLLQSDGKIVVGGIFTDYNGTPANNIIRLQADGTADTTFHTGTGFNGYVYSIQQQMDGKYVVGGHFTAYNGDTLMIRIARLNANGTADPSFQVGLGPNNIVTRIKIRPDGKILAVGFFTRYDTLSKSRIVRLLPNGSADNTFAVGSGFNSNVNDLLLLADGKLIATGNFTSYKGSAINRIIRIDTTGARDNSFAPGSGLNLSCNAVFLCPDNSVLVGGTFTQADSFARFRLVKLLSTGKVDHSFFTESKLNGQTRALGVQSSGKAVVTGQFTRCNQVMANRIMRMNTDGTVDTSFKSGTGANNAIRTITVLPDDKLLIGGDFTSYNGKAITRIARLSADGILDTTFTPGSGFNGVVYAIVTDSSGKIYVAGNFTLFAGDTVNRITRLHPNGTHDAGFNVGKAFNNYVYDILLQPDGNLVAAGAFTTYQGVPANRLIRLFPDGSRDLSFATGTGANNIIYSLALSDDGKVLIGGSFTKFNNVTKNRLARLNIDGSLDVSFTGNVNNGIVYDVLPVKTGTLIGGTFTSVSSTAVKRVAFVNATGTLNTTAFYTGAGFNATLNNFFKETTQRTIYALGDFTEAQGRLYNRLMRMRYTDIVLNRVATVLCPGAITKVYFTKGTPFIPGNTFTVQLSDSLGRFSTALNIGATSSTASGKDSVTIYLPNNLPAGSYYRVRIIATNPVDTSNVSAFIRVSTPAAPTVLASGPTTFCTGDSITLSVAAGNAYSWNTGASTAAIVVRNSGSYVVTVNSNNCIAASAPVAVSTLPAPDSTITVAAASLCNGGSVKLTASPNLNYQWSVGPTTPSITVSQSGIYSVTLTDSAGCVSHGTANMNLSDFFNHLIMPDSTSVVCEGTGVTLSSIAGVSYLWSNQQTTQSITITASGSYYLTVTDGICTLSAGPVQVVVNPLPVVSFSLPADTFCSNASAIPLTANPTGGVFSGNGVSGATFTPQGLGNTSVTLMYQFTDNQGCTGQATDTAVVEVCTGWTEWATHPLTVYPNPATDKVYCNSDQPITQPIYLFSASGEKILEISPANTASPCEISLAALAAGVYFLQTGNHRFRLVKLQATNPGN